MRTVPAVLCARIGEHAATPSAGTDRARVHGALALGDLLTHVTRVLAAYEDAIADTVACHCAACLFAGLPQTGPVTVAALIAKIGEDRSRFPTAGSLRAEAGLARSPDSLGRCAASSPSMRRITTCAPSGTSGPSRRSGSRRGREPFTTPHARGQSYNRAVRSVGARWGRILWRFWRDRVAYNPVLDRRVALAA